MTQVTIAKIRAYGMGSALKAQEQVERMDRVGTRRLFSKAVSTWRD
jgi:hypothetical protein